MKQTHTTGGLDGVLYSLIFLLVLSVGTALGAAGDTPRRGGTLRVAIGVSWPTLDPHSTAVGTTWIIANHWLEGLYTTGLDGGPIPMLAEGHTISDDGLLYTVKLRRGVPFHHGKELTAADVVPSLRRWGRKHPWGRELFTRVASVQPLDKYTVQLHLKAKSALVLPLLIGAIYPKEVVEEAGDGEVKTYIGTGPLQVADHQPQRSVKLARFAGYQARPEPPYGYGGGKTAWLDTLLFLWIPDASARMAAVESREADFAAVNPDDHDRLKAHPDLKVFIQKRFMRLCSMLNAKRGLFTNVTLRQAALAALDMEPILRAAAGHPELYRLDSSLWPKEEPWWTDVGRERYNQKDPAKARRLLKEAGYQGEPVRYLVAQDVDWFYRSSFVIKQQLEEVGVVIDLQVLTWATLLQRLNNPDLWDAFTCGFVTYEPDAI